jgi:5-methylcytosine-specific restriction enzyme subunit McrC
MNGIPQPPGRAPTYLLTERIAAECRLSSVDVDALLSHHRAHVRLTPTGRRHRYRLTPLGHVGVIVVPHCRLVIRPKIPLRNLFHLLDPLTPVPIHEDRVDHPDGSEVLDFLAGRLAHLLAERAAAGLHRAYAERAQSGPYLHGRLDVAAQVGNPGGRKDRLHCRYDDFTVDVPCNRLPRATAELVLRSPLLGDRVRAALVQQLGAFAGVEPMALTRDSVRSVTPDRLTEAYRPLLDVCRLLAEGLGPGERAGSETCPAFLLDMERVFEQYVTGRLVATLDPGGPLSASVQPLLVVNERVAGQPDIHMRPDVVLAHEGERFLVLDAKWKRPTRNRLVTEDLYQMLAYCTALGVSRGVLVYPGDGERVWRYRLPRTPTVVEVRQVTVSGSQEDCLRSLHRFLRAVRERPRLAVDGRQ